MELGELFKQLGIALGLGLLVGLQRERTDSRIAGFRTFPLITLAGTLCALLAQEFGAGIFGVGLASLAVVMIVGNLPMARSHSEGAPGVTTEMAMIIMFIVGGCLAIELIPVGVAVAGTVAMLLHLKPEMHAWAARMGERDFKAMMQFVLISLVILPVLPNEYYGPYGVLNPFKIWLMVVLIVGISLGGYVVYKFVGQRTGALAAGILGGLISSTATAVSYARRARQTPEFAGQAAFVIVVASAIVFVRVLILITATSPTFLRSAVAPVLVMFGVLAAIAAGSWYATRMPKTPMAEQANPTELRPAFLFAVLYALVLLGVAAAKEHLGQGGLYLAAVLSGLTDMDAITLSITQLVSAGTVSPETGWKCILIASMSNLVFKAAAVALLGGRHIFRRVAVSFGFAFAVGVLLVAI
jgi:uncharacterized membrane protein (DUF4010 family)